MEFIPKGSERVNKNKRCTFQKDNNKIVKNKNKEYTIQKKTGMKNKTRTSKRYQNLEEYKLYF